MRYLRFEHIALSSLLVLSPICLTACSGKEEPKTTVSAPEVVETSKLADPVAAPVATPEKMAPEKIETPVAEVAKPIETPPPVPEEPAKAESPAEVVNPELPDADDESIQFFPKLDVGKTLDAVIEEYAADKYTNTILVYVGENEEKLAKYKDNIHIAFCKCSGAEGICIISPTDPRNYNGIIIMGHEGFVDSFYMGHGSGKVDVPKDYPPLSVNWPDMVGFDQIPPEIMALLQSMEGCGYAL